MNTPNDGRQMKLRPINIAGVKLTEQTRAIEPSLVTAEETIRPCALRMKDGTFVPRAYCRENARYSDKGEWINPEKVEAIVPSPFRMPVELARQLYGAGESGMGYIIFILQFRDGRSLVCVAGNLGIDFLDLPEGYAIEDAVAVIPHEGRDRSVTEGYRSGAEFAFLDYVPFDSPQTPG